MRSTMKRSFAETNDTLRLPLQLKELPEQRLSGADTGIQRCAMRKQQICAAAVKTGFGVADAKAYCRRPCSSLCTTTNDHPQFSPLTLSLFTNFPTSITLSRLPFYLSQVVLQIPVSLCPCSRCSRSCSSVDLTLSLQLFPPYPPSQLHCQYPFFPLSTYYIQISFTIPFQVSYLSVSFCSML